MRRAAQAIARRSLLPAAFPAQLRFCSEPAWAAESRRRAEEEVRRREKRKAAAEVVDLTTDNTEEGIDVHPEAARLPVVEEDGWLLFQDHDSFPHEVAEEWNPTHNTSDPPLRAVEEAKFHCEKNQYGGFIQKWSLIYFFKQHPPKRLLAGRRPCAKDDVGVFDLHINPVFDGVSTMSPAMRKELDDAIANGTAPVKKDIGSSYDPEDSLAGDLLDETSADVPVAGAMEMETLEHEEQSFRDNLEKLQEQSEKGAGEASSEKGADAPPPVGGGQAAKAAGQDEEEAAKNDLRTRSLLEKLSEALPPPVSKANAAPAARGPPPPAVEARRPPSPAQQQPPPRSPAAAAAPPAQPQEQASEPAPALPVSTPVYAIRDITVGGQLAIRKGTEGIVMGGATSGDGRRMHVKFARREQDKNPSLNVTLREVQPLDD
ncbi:hypothetical protein DIPPA_22829 [Diplonema papillatum]|nr:hypothetical protein DIPPA_22829 [Diplonema papillatum]